MTNRTRLDPSTPLTGCDKGMPGGMEPISLAQVGAQGWNVLREDMPLPLAVLKKDAIEHNSTWMRKFLAETGAHIAPHGKTSMSPQLFDLQIKDGAWAITVSTPHQIQVARAAGHQRIVLANQLIGRKSIEFVLDELRADPEFEFYCLVDSVETVARLADAARANPSGRPIHVLLEGGYAGGRTGCRTLEQAMGTARAAAAAYPFLVLGGIEGFEGLIHKSSPAESIAAVEVFLSFLSDIARACAAEDLFNGDKVILSAGGSVYYDIVARTFSALDLGRPAMTLIRSGCYLTHDSVLYALATPFFQARNPGMARHGDGLQAAIEVWAYVQSRPEPELVIVTMGKRDLTPDHMPKLERWFRPDGAMREPSAAPRDHQVVSLNDQHAMMRVPSDSPLAVGDMLGFGIGHPCLTFDKWRVMPVVNEAYDVVSAIRTYF